MFGTARFVLALLVVAAHLGIWIWLGVYAVFGFYVISGYLMCLVLNKRYGFTFAGLRVYAVNRFLRIYPPYWVACAIGVVLLNHGGQEAMTAYWQPWTLPGDWRDWLDNIVLVTLPADTSGARLVVPPAWALRVEVFYYLVLGLGLARSRNIALAWVLAGVAYHFTLADSGVFGWRERYYPIAAASLPFSLGALIYHTNEKIPSWLRSNVAVPSAIVLLWVSNLFLSPSAFGSVWGVGRFYLNLVLVASFVALMSVRRARDERWYRFDMRLGDLSYPIYLVHLPLGFALVALGVLSPFKGQEVLLVLLSLPPVLLLAWAMLHGVDYPIERLRDRVKAAFERASNGNSKPA